MDTDDNMTKKKAFCRLIVCILLFAGVLFVLIYGGIHWFKPDSNPPPPQTVTIVNANLTRFELITASPDIYILYNVTFTMGIQNADSYGDAYYKSTEVDCYHNGKQFDSMKLQDFCLIEGSKTMFNFSTSGHSTVNLEANGVDVLARSNPDRRFFDMEIWLKGERISINGYGLDAMSLSYQCKLRLPLLTPHANSSHHKFEHVECMRR